MIFTGFLSVTFLNNKISNVKWLGIITSCLGLVIVGISDFISSKNVSFIDTNGIITGSLHLFLNLILIKFLKAIC
jgi:drug/metabolite transporter (DMT)-like permease